MFQVRNVYNEVAGALLFQGEKEKAAELLMQSVRQFPLSKIPHDVFCIRQAELMLDAGIDSDAEKWFLVLEKNILETLEYYKDLSKKQQFTLADEIQRELSYLNQLVQISSKLNDDSKKVKLELHLKTYYGELMGT